MEKKCIVIGITGGIAVYKMCSVVSSLKKKGHEVHVLMTKEAEQFVTPLTFQTLSAQRVITDMFAVDFQPDVHHISLAKKADLMVIAPATANIIAKTANGIADDMLTTTFLAATCRKLIVPAMNTAMLENPITQDNIAKCRKYGMEILESGEGYLACGDVGKGRLPEPEVIVDKIEEMLVNDSFLGGKKVLITAGPTREEMDPVRYITNHSSGKMGYALARAARNFGADVTLVSGHTSLSVPLDVNYVPVTSAADMADAVLSRKDETDVIIMAAAVADYTPAVRDDNKIKKADDDMIIELKRTTDILKTLGDTKRDGQVLIGFAMETQNLLENAEKKLTSKNVDYVVANSVTDEGAGFGVDTNKVVILSKEKQYPLDLMSKDDVASEVLKYCLKK